MRIVYCINRIRHIGGMQRMVAAKANALAEISGNEVYIVVTDHKNGIDAFYLSPDVKVVDLDINYYSSHGKSPIADILIYKKKKSKHRKAFARFLRETQPDIVISTGGYEKSFLTGIRRHAWKTLIEYHYERNYKANNKRSNILHQIQGWYDTQVLEKRFDRIVVLTHHDKEYNWKGYKNVTVIPNPVPFACEQPSDLQCHCVTSVGRLVSTKNFPGLIRAFRIVAEKYPGWILKIYGDGPEKKNIERVIESENLQGKVFLAGHVRDVEMALRQSSVFAFSSLSEGFGLALIEAMECGVPVVSYDCPYGPREIITDGEDGFLVPMNDESFMADRICALIDDEQLRWKMGILARQKARQYHINSIIEQWMKLFNEMMNT